MSKKCPNCNKIYYGDEYYCIKDRYRLIPITNKEDYYIPKTIESQPNTPKCPTCGSTDLKKISTTSKVVGAAMFGLFSKTARSQFECKNCGYKW